MQSSNPIFRRSEGFNGRGNATMSSPATWSTGAAAGAGHASGGYDQGGYGGGYGQAPQVDQGRMSIDSVVQKTGMTLGVVVLFAAATWFLTPNLSEDPSAVSTLYALSMFGALAGFALAMVNSFKKVISPALVLAYAAVEGIFVGAFSKSLEAMFGDGLVIGAVLGTMAAVAGTLAAYKFFDIKVTPKFRMWVMGALMGFVAVSLLNFVLRFFGADFGFNGFGTMGLISSVIALGLGVLLLILDFDFVERGIEAGLPERESWRAAFGLTVTIIWIYIELLRLLAILRGSD